MGLVSTDRLMLPPFTFYKVGHTLYHPLCLSFHELTLSIVHFKPGRSTPYVYFNTITGIHNNSVELASRIE